MNNWLNEEENRKAELETFNRSKSEIAHRLFEKFESICKRVNAVKPLSFRIYLAKDNSQNTLGSGKPLSLDIKWTGVYRGNILEIVGNNKFIVSRREGRYDQTEGGTYIKRGIKLEVVDHEKVVIDLFTRFGPYDIYRLDGKISVYDHSFLHDDLVVFLQHEASHSQIISWSEDEMLKCIEWLLLESDQIKSIVPGVKSLSEHNKKSLALIQEVEKLKKEYYSEKFNLAEINGFQFGRSQYTKEKEVKAKKEEIESIIYEIEKLKLTLKRRYFVNDVE